MNRLKQSFKLKKILTNQVLGVRPKVQQGGEINPATSVNPDRAFYARPGSLRWLNFPIPVGLVGGYYASMGKISEKVEPDFDDFPDLPEEPTYCPEPPEDDPFEDDPEEPIEEVDYE